MLKNLKNNGFASIVEVIVTSIIFVIAVAGILTTMSMLRPAGEESAKKLEAAYIAKQELERLRGQIDASTWDNASFNYLPGTYSKVVVGDTGNYTVNWIVSNVPNLNLRQVNMTVTFPDD